MPQEKGMRKLFIILFVITFFISFNTWAQNIDIIDIQSACETISKPADVIHVQPTDCDNSEKFKDNKHLTNYDHNLIVSSVNTETQEVLQSLITMDESDISKLCDKFTNSTETDELQALTFDIPESDSKKKKWKVIFTFGPFIAFHHKMDLQISNGNTNATLRGIKPLQRTSFHHYNVFSGRTKPGQFLDEPQNRITLEIVNDKMFLGLEYSHPKILFQDQYATPDNNQNVSIEGVIAGQDVNVQNVPLKNYIYQIQASHGNTNINAFAGRNYTLTGEDDGNNLQLQVGGTAGVSFANGVTKYYQVDNNGESKLQITENQGMKIYGLNLGAKIRLRHNFLKGRMNATLKYDGVYTRLDGPLGGFDVKGNLFSHQIGVSVGLRLDGIFKKKKNRRK